MITHFIRQRKPNIISSFLSRPPVVIITAWDLYYGIMFQYTIFPCMEMHGLKIICVEMTNIDITSRYLTDPLFLLYSFQSTWFKYK